MELGVAVVLLSGQASGARQEIAACYDAHFRGGEIAKEEISALRLKLAAIRERKEVLDVKLESFYELAKIKDDAPSQSDYSLLKLKCQEFARRATSYEVNELLLKRRHAILDEDMRIETDRRIKVEHALTDLDAMLRGRILYLELWKQGASARVERLQTELNDSVPASQWPCVNTLLVCVN